MIASVVWMGFREGGRLEGPPAVQGGFYPMGANWGARAYALASRSTATWPGPSPVRHYLGGTAQCTPLFARGGSRLWGQSENHMQ